MMRQRCTVFVSYWTSLLKSCPIFATSIVHLTSASHPSCSTRGQTTTTVEQRVEVALCLILRWHRVRAPQLRNHVTKTFKILSMDRYGVQLVRHVKISRTNEQDVRAKRPQSYIETSSVKIECESLSDYGFHGHASTVRHEAQQRGETNTVADALSDNPQAVFGPVPNPNPPARKGFFCKVCGEHISSMSEEQHRSSTLHIFNLQHPSRSRKVQLDESNKGFRILAGMGWNVDEGLGAQKQGRVAPLRTTFKTDTTGLGAGPKLRPRVTHFPSHVPSQARNSVDGKSNAIRAHESLERRDGKRRGELRGWARDRGVVGHADQGNSAPGGVLGDHGPRHSRKRGRISSDGMVHDPRRGRSCSSLASGDDEHRGSVDDGAWGCRGDGVHMNGKGSSLGSGGVGGSGSERVSNRLGEKRAVDGKKKVVGAGSSGVFMSRAERIVRDKAKHRSDRRWRMELLSDIPDEFQALFSSD